MTPDDLAAIEARHQVVNPPKYAEDDPGWCADDRKDWPCDARVLLDERQEQDRVAAVAFLAGADDEREHHAASDVLAYEAGMTAGAREQAERIWEAIDAEDTIDGGIHRDRLRAIVND